MWSYRSTLLLSIIGSILILASPASTQTVASDAPTSAPEKKLEKKDEPVRLFRPLVWGPDDEWKLQFGGDTRIRGEHRDNWDMDRSVGDNDKLGFARTRLNWDLTYRSFIRAFIEISDSREIDPVEPMNQENYLDLQQAFLEFANTKVTPWGLRVGRQEMNLGRDRRLSEASGWNNLRRRFLGARLMYRSEDVDVDTFVFQPEYYETKYRGDIVSDRGRPRSREWFYGTYVTLKQWDPHTIEAYFLGLSDLDDNRVFPGPVESEEGVVGSLDRYTAGIGMYGPIWKRKDCGTLTYTTDMAYQFGHKSEDQIRAYMLHGDLAYEWDRPMKPMLKLIGNLGSGDRRRGDGQSNTFHPLYGSSHSPYGIIDFVRLQNMRELALEASAQPTEKLKAKVGLHAFWLDSKTDSWYNGRGSSRGRDDTGNSGRHIGNEINAVLNYKLTKFVTLEAGAAHFRGGQVARNFGQRDGANLLYVQTTITF
jgi:hypothetical protein